MVIAVPYALSAFKKSVGKVYFRLLFTSLFVPKWRKGLPTRFLYLRKEVMDWLEESRAATQLTRGKLLINMLDRFRWQLRELKGLDEVLEALKVIPPPRP